LAQSTRGSRRIDADIRRIDEVEEALTLTGCAKVAYLVNTHEHFDHTSANYYFAQRQIPTVASAGCTRAMKRTRRTGLCQNDGASSAALRSIPGLSADRAGHPLLSTIRAPKFR
jgi:glyoxylase-like metal-dependent hydrolase (beta-lactamase superfamily II)